MDTTQVAVYVGRIIITGGPESDGINATARVHLRLDNLPYETWAEVGPWLGRDTESAKDAAEAWAAEHFGGVALCR